MKMEAWGLRLKWWGAEVGAIWGYRVQVEEEEEKKKIKQRCYSVLIFPSSSEPVTRCLSVAAISLFIHLKFL